MTVTTAGGISGAQPFTITLPLPGSMTFTPTGEEQTFLVPAGVVSILIQAEGGAGGDSVLGANGGDGGRAIARVSVTPGAPLTVRVGGGGQFGTPTIGGRRLQWRRRQPRETRRRGRRRFERA